MYLFQAQVLLQLPLRGGWIEVLIVLKCLHSQVPVQLVQLPIKRPDELHPAYGTQKFNYTR